ncbi:MAG: hypothetical protein M3384_06705 [Acidobacteriota bacterium]|nr:hypothetical protein [Acidobacteriota bacterium]
MNVDEIKNYTSNRSICVDISIMPQYSGFVRKVIFYIRNRVCVEFVGYSVGNNESGHEFCCTFSSPEDAVASIEDYLSKPVKDWTNHTKTGDFPLIKVPTDIKAGHEKLREDIINKKIFIPRIGNFKPNFDISLL